MNVVAYCRVSTDGQAQEDKFGIDNQKAIITRYAEQHGMVVLDWYIDQGASGVKESRPAMDRLLFTDNAMNPPIEAVLVAKSDRIARDIKLYFYYMMVLERKKIQLISCTEQIVNDDTGLGNVYRSLMLFVAEQERKNIMKRTSGGRSIKSQRGGYSGGRPPYGYEARNHCLMLLESEAEIVSKIFEMKYQRYTLQDIIDHLTSSGIRSRSGGAFTLSTISGILSNEKLYKGYYRYKGSPDPKAWVKGEHEAILPDVDLQEYFGE